jgi:PAS domain S-box-containing protein
VQEFSCKGGAMRDEDKTKEQLLEEMRHLRARVWSGEAQVGPAEHDHEGLVGAWTLDLHSGVVSWSNDQWRRFGLPSPQTNLTFEQALGRIHPEDRALIERVMAQARNDHQPFEYPFRTIANDGQTHHLHCRGHVTVGRDGKPETLSGVVWDVDEQRRADEALALNQRRYQAFFENALDCILLMDDSGRYVDGNPAVCQMLGYTREELRQLNVWDITPAIDREQIPALMKQFFDAGTMSGQYELLCKDGSTRTVEFRAVANVLPGLHVAVQRDITQRNRDEAERRRQAEIWQTIFDNIPVMISFMGADGRIQLVNRHWQEVLGWSLEEARQIDVLTEMTPDEQTRRVAIEYVNNPPPGWADGTVRTRDGRLLETSWAMTILSDGTRIGIGQDVTARKQTEQALASQAARLEALSRRLVEVQEEERRHLARELHDEIGQLLTSLKFALEASAGGPPDAAAAGLSQARGLIEEALGWVRQRSFDLRPALLDHLGLLPALRGLIERYGASTGVQVNLQYARLEGRLAPHLETAAYRVVQEALTNVARHAGTKEVEVRVWLSGATLSVQVEDQGVGFDADAVLAAGQSAGLPGVQERVRLLGGRLTIDSTPGGGTHLMAELPLDPASGKCGREDRAGGES